jgi:hypothetical protein
MDNVAFNRAAVGEAAISTSLSFGYLASKTLFSQYRRRSASGSVRR